MSYCVNCGVELEKSLSQCPLCNTPVMNPRQMKIVPKSEEVKFPSPFPEEKGQIENVNRTDMAILLTTFVVATAVICGLLNLLVFKTVPWSLAIIGGCILLWAILIPVVIYANQSVYVSIALDGCAMAVYLFLLTYLTQSKVWFWELGLPIVILVTILLELFVLCLRKLPKSFLGTALYAVTAVALLCLGLESLIDLFVAESVMIGWSAIVATVCEILDITILTLLSRKRLRNEVRRRLHF